MHAEFEIVQSETIWYLAGTPDSHEVAAVKIQFKY